MAYSLPLPSRLARQWTVKIRDRERVEPPHVTILRGTRGWRVDLRSGEYLDEEPDPRDVPAEVRRALDDHWDELRRMWDSMYPENPVSGETEPDDE